MLERYPIAITKRLLDITQSKKLKLKKQSGLTQVTIGGSLSILSIIFIIFVKNLNFMNRIKIIGVFSKC